MQKSSAKGTNSAISSTSLLPILYLYRIFSIPLHLFSSILEQTGHQKTHPFSLLLHLGLLGSPQRPIRPGPELEYSFYIAVLSEGEMILLVGDLEREAYAKTRALRRSKDGGKSQPLVLRREHVIAKNKFYCIRIDLGGKSRLISIKLNESCEEDPRLVSRFDQKMVIQVKHLKWKFRGSERIEADRHPIQLSWDVYNLFDSKDANQDDVYALFTFRFEK